MKKVIELINKYIEENTGRWNELKKSEIIETIATITGLTKADVTRVFEAINNKQTLNEEKELINFC